MLGTLTKNTLSRRAFVNMPSWRFLVTSALVFLGAAFMEVMHLSGQKAPVFTHRYN